VSARRPLDPLRDRSSIASLLRAAPPALVATELERLAAEALAPAEAAALLFARGALALRGAELDAARALFERAASALDALGLAAERDLARAEAWLAAIRRGPRAAYLEAARALDDLAAGAASDLARLVATHYRAAAARAAGDGEAARRALLDALPRSAPFLDERAQILTSLGTLYVALGAPAAAEPLLEHAAELHRLAGDAVGEAVSQGQLGAAALARGDLDRARRHLQMQEWLAARTGDAFGRARALVWLADVALAAGRPDDALDLARDAAQVARATSPPLTLWEAYAARAAGRARVDLGDPASSADLDRAGALFAAEGHPLGAALIAWDRARAAPDAPLAHWAEAASALASLGLSARVAELLRDLREARPSDVTEEAVAAASQTAPHVALAREVDLVHEAPDELALLTRRRSAAATNLARLGALALAEPGLVVAVLASDAISVAAPMLPPPDAAAAALFDAPGLAVWAWPATTSLAAVARDLAAARAALGASTRASAWLAPSGRVRRPPFAGEVGARLEGVALAPRLGVAASLPAAELDLDPALAWSPEADALARAAGYQPSCAGEVGVEG
jgi:hypothetical protein